MPDIIADYVEITPEKILAHFNLTKAYKTGAWDIVAMNPDGETALLPEAFLIHGFDMIGNKLIPVNNLFNPSLGEKVYIKYSIEKNETVNLKIYNLKGEIVKTLLNNIPLAKGVYQQEWLGDNDGSKQISSGILTTL